MSHVHNFAQQPRPALLCDVTPRDGLQNEKRVLDTATKLELVRRLVESGLRRIELTSFVNPRRVPQMADADAVAEAVLGTYDSVVFSALVLNERGMERAIKAGFQEVNAVVVCTDTFCRRNQGMSTDNAVRSFTEMAQMAREAGVRTTVTLAAAFGCPFEGEVPVERVAEIAASVFQAGPQEVLLADTIGVAVPADIRARVAAVREVIGGGADIRLHLHDTRNTAVANALTALEVGVTALDSTVGGFGGCPFAPAATGNVATEDLSYALERSGVEAGVDRSQLISTAHWLGKHLQRPVPGSVANAGGFPTPRVTTRQAEQGVDGDGGGTSEQ